MDDIPTGTPIYSQQRWGNGTLSWHMMGTAIAPPPPTPDLPLLRKLIDWAEDESRKLSGEWFQGSYAVEHPICGTTFCIAGKAVMLAEPRAELRGCEHPEEDATSCRCGALHLFIDGRERGWNTEARRILGLTDEEATDLFSGYNAISRVRMVARQIARRAGEEL